jgi:hypothetical protein
VGDPFLCYPRTMQQFGQIVFPRGTYLVGHLESDKEPGHFVGKGYLKLAFDRIGLPASDVPLTAKVIAVAGYNVDREGKIIGHGHATRDTVEWMLPPFWPWKIITLPARGPRPTLKGEVRVTLRVMDDIIVPQFTNPGWHRFGEQPSSFPVPRSQAVPQPRAVAAVSYQPMVDAVATQEAPRVAVADADTNTPRVSYVPAGLTTATNSPDATAPESYAPAGLTTAAAPSAGCQPAAVVARPAMASSLVPERTPATAWAANVTLFALADGTVFPATQYWRDQDHLWYVSEGDKGTVALNSIDWSTTTKLNVARNVRVILRNAPATN